MKLFLQRDHFINHYVAGCGKNIRRTGPDKVRDVFHERRAGSLFASCPAEWVLQLFVSQQGAA